MINLDNIKQTVVDKFLGLVYGDQMTTEAYQLGKVVAKEVNAIHARFEQLNVKATNTPTAFKISLIGSQ